MYDSTTDATYSRAGFGATVTRWRRPTEATKVPRAVAPELELAVAPTAEVRDLKRA